MEITGKNGYKAFSMETKPFHLSFITEEFARRSQKNPHYSLRSFARDLNVAPSWLSDFLSGKKGLSLQTAEKFLPLLGMSANEGKLFLLSARAFHSRSASEKEKAHKELAQYKKTNSYKVRAQDYSKIGSWYHQAILELTELENFSHHEFEIAERLRLPLPTIRRALADLQEAGLLEIQDGKMKACFAETESSVDLPSLAIRKYHEQILQQGVRALHEQAVQDREFTSVTFAFDTDRTEDAKKALRDFQKKFTDEFYTNSKKKDGVYQLSFQLFRMDKKRI